MPDRTPLRPKIYRNIHVLSPGEIRDIKMSGGLRALALRARIFFFRKALGRLHTACDKKESVTSTNHDKINTDTMIP